MIFSYNYFKWNLTTPLLQYLPPLPRGKVRWCTWYFHLPTSYPPLHTYKNLTPLTSSNTQLQQPELSATSSATSIVSSIYQRKGRWWVCRRSVKLKGQRGLQPSLQLELLLHRIVLIRAPIPTITLELQIVSTWPISRRSSNACVSSWINICIVFSLSHDVS